MKRIPHFIDGTFSSLITVGDKRRTQSLKERIERAKRARRDARLANFY